MKVIGLKDKDTYIAEISHKEIEKVFDKFYGKMETIKVGQVIHLDTGYDFSIGIKETCSSMVEASRSFDRNFDLLLRFAHMIIEKNNKDK
jgi:hypothetical protein